METMAAQDQPCSFGDLPQRTSNGRPEAFRPGLLFAIFIQIILVACSSVAQPKSEHIRFVKGEAIRDFVPDGWVWIGDHDSGGLREPMNYYSPADQVGEDWNEQIILALPNFSGTPSEVIDEAIYRSFQHKCERYKVEAIEETTRNGYSTATKLVYCGENRFSSIKKGSVGINVALNSKSVPCLLFRQMRFDSFNIDNPPISVAMKSELLNWAKRIYMCNARDPAHPCPKIKW